LALCRHTDQGSGDEFTDNPVFEELRFRKSHMSDIPTLGPRDHSPITDDSVKAICGVTKRNYHLRRFNNLEWPQIGVPYPQRRQLRIYQYEYQR
jgi:hypothetical protein